MLTVYPSKEIQEARNCSLSCDIIEKDLKRLEYLVKEEVTGLTNTLMRTTVFSDMQRAYVREMDKISPHKAKDISSETSPRLALAAS
jgi:hypothetical protein